MPSEAALIPSDWLQPDWQQPHVRAFMTTRAGGVSQGPFASLNLGQFVNDDPAHVASNRARVSQALGMPVVFHRQAHGVQVIQLGTEHLQAPAEPQHEPARYDGFVCTTPGLGLAVQVADCLPVLFAAPRGVAGAHAGWRGLSGGVLENTIAALCQAANCLPADLHAWMGACIGAEAFEVGADVLQAFGQDPAAPESAFFVYRPNEQGQPRWRADLTGLARQRLLEAGVGQISGGEGWCTYRDSERFFSYRRAPVSGRMAAVIGLV